MNTIKTLIRCLLASILALYAHAEAGAETLTIIVEEIREAKGTIYAEVLAGRAQFDGNGEAAQFELQAVAGSMTLVAEDLPAGEYAIRVMQDVNGNEELDTNWFGVPTEPWAFSNNAKGSFGPPSWADVRFMLEGDVTQSVSLVH